MYTAVQNTLAVTPQPPPSFGLIYEGAIALVVGQDRRHLFVTLCTVDKGWPWGE
jgi:hypothetical protein